MFITLAALFCWKRRYPSEATTFWTQWNETCAVILITVEWCACQLENLFLTKIRYQSERSTFWKEAYVESVIKMIIMEWCDYHTAVLLKTNTLSRRVKHGATIIFTTFCIHLLSFLMTLLSVWASYIQKISR